MALDPAGMPRRALLLLVCGLFLLALPPGALAKCPNWCSQSGICTGPGDDSFCICEMGFQGDDCGTRELRGLRGELVLQAE